MTRFPRPSKKSAYAGNGIRMTLGQVVVVVAAGLSIGASAIGIEVYATSRWGNGSGVSLGGPDSYTGAILYRPDTGSLCRQILFNNQSGQSVDKGYVDCEHAAYPNPVDGAEPTVASRARVIANGFRGF